MALAKISLESAVASVARMPVDAPSFVLGSSSWSRRTLLEATGANFEIMSPSIDEKAIGERANGDAHTLVQLVATAKADTLVARLKPKDDVVLITGDQVVVYDGVIREKPMNEDECREFIQSYSAKACSTVGAICLHELATNRRVVGLHEASVYFRPFPQSLVEELLRQSGPALLNCAGGLMVEHDLVQPYVQEVVGGVDSLMGLSTNLLVDLLAELDRTPFPHAAATA